MYAGRKAPTVSNFRDVLVFAIIESFGVDAQSSVQAVSLMIRHGSTPFVGWKKCVVYHKRCNRKCPDCQFEPTLCQSTKKDCREKWHCNQFTVMRSHWFARLRGSLNRPLENHHSMVTRTHSHSLAMTAGRQLQSQRLTLPRKRREGRPNGSKDKRRRKKRVLWNCFVV